MGSSCNHQRYSKAIIKDVTIVTYVVIEILIVLIENLELLEYLSEYYSQIHVSLEGNYHFIIVLLPSSSYRSIRYEDPSTAITVSLLKILRSILIHSFLWLDYLKIFYHRYS